MIAASILHQSRSLLMRRTVPNDASLLYEKAYSNREFMHLYRLNDAPSCEAEVYQRLVQRQNDPNRHLNLQLLVIHRKHGPIGIAGLAAIVPLHRRAEYVLGLFEDKYRSAGYGLEAGLMLLDLAFNRYNLHKLSSVVYGYNQSAQKGTSSGGFSLVGIDREHIFDLETQEFVDLYRYGMTENDFRQNKRLIPLAKRFLNRDITQKQTSSMPVSKSPYMKSGTITLQAPALNISR